MVTESRVPSLIDGEGDPIDRIIDAYFDELDAKPGQDARLLQKAYLERHPEYVGQLEPLFRIMGPGQDSVDNSSTTGSLDWLDNAVEDVDIGNGTRIGPYVLLERLGEGGMGVVYTARHEALKHQIVAIKLVRTGATAQEQFKARFRREQRAMGRAGAHRGGVAAAHLVCPYYAGNQGPLLYLVMEYLEGTDLSKLIEGGRSLEPADACEYVRQASLAAQEAHERGITHRDIKPSNLFLDRTTGRIKLIDFGLARLHPEHPMSRPSTVLTNGWVGTFAYMAPEQATNPSSVDGRADVFSLGCTLYHLLSGQPPFPKETWYERLGGRAEIEPTPIERLRPGLPRGLGAVVRRMMTHDPDRRYQTAAGAAAALAAFTRKGRCARRLAMAAVAVLASLAAAAVVTLVPRLTVAGREASAQAALTAKIPDFAPNSSSDAVDSIKIVFSEPTDGFDLSDLKLTRGDAKEANLLTPLQTLSSDDDVVWTLGNLAGLTGVSGRYTLSLPAAGAGITGRDGAALRSSPRATWQVDRPASDGWAVREGQGGPAPNDGGRALAVDRQGNVYVAGSQFGEGDPGNNPGNADMLIAKYSPKGVCLWKHVLGGPRDDRASGVALSPSGGSVYVVGRFQDVVDFDPGPRVRSFSADGSQKAVILEFSAAKGALIGARCIDSPWSSADAIAVDSRGFLLVGGVYSGPLTLQTQNGAAEHTSAGGLDIFLVKLNPSGQCLWSKTFGGPGQFDSVARLTTDRERSVFLTGYFTNTVDFGQGPADAVLTPSVVRGMSSNTFILKLSESGAFAWVKRLDGDGGWQTGQDIVVDAAGSVYVTGSFQGIVDFDPGAPEKQLKARDNDAFVLKLDSTGSFVWVRPIGSSGDDRGMGLALAPGGGVHAAGHFQGVVDFGGGLGETSDKGMLSSRGDRDVYLLRFDPSGRLLASLSFGGTGEDSAWCVANDSGGAIHLTGFFNDVMTIETGAYPVTLKSAGAKDVFTVKRKAD